MERLSIKLFFSDDYDSAWYKFTVSPNLLIFGHEVEIVMTDYEGIQIFGPPVETYLYSSCQKIDALRRAIDRFEIDLRYKRHARDNQEGTRRVPSS